MASFNIVMPKLGESIQEGTITKWFVKEGDTIEEDDMLFEVATDKVDSEIPSPVDGVITKINYEEDSLVAVGEVLAVVSLDGEVEETESEETESKAETEPTTGEAPAKAETETTDASVDDSRKTFKPFLFSFGKNHC